MSPTVSIGPMEEALRLMLRAIKILDREKAPADIGAHLDLAIHRLQRTIATLRQNGKGPF